MSVKYKEPEVVERLSRAEELGWINQKLISWEEAKCQLNITMEDIEEAEERLQRFAPFIMKCFPETIDRRGLIESELTSVDSMQKFLEEEYKTQIPGRLLLKRDSDLAVAGSIKARGGIYEVLKYTEELALKEGMITLEDDYAKLADDSCREFFKQHKIQVGSTGNLGLSIGIASAAVGYQVIVHMSADAKQWKKDLLRSHGVTVVEYASDYSEAVKNGRAESDKDPMSYFVDDENSKNLFMGYAVAAKRLVKQLEEQGITIGNERPMFVYIPCGVGGAPGGVAFGLKQIWGDNVHVFFVEPVQAPCMVLGMASGLHSGICVQDIGLTGLTHADGLAVGRPSGFVGKVMEPVLSGEFTMEDKKLYNYMRALLVTEDLFIEPSACAAFEGPLKLMEYEAMKQYIHEHGLADKMNQAVHIAWATGGRLVPKEIRKEYQNTYL